MASRQHVPRSCTACGRRQRGFAEHGRLPECLRPAVLPPSAAASSAGGRRRAGPAHPSRAPKQRLAPPLPRGPRGCRAPGLVRRPGRWRRLLVPPGRCSAAGRRPICTVPPSSPTSARRCRCRCPQTSAPAPLPVSASVGWAFPSPTSPRCVVTRAPRPSGRRSTSRAPSRCWRASWHWTCCSPGEWSTTRSCVRRPPRSRPLVAASPESPGRRVRRRRAGSTRGRRCPRRRPRRASSARSRGCWRGGPGSPARPP